jgi:amino acid permease
MAYSIFTVMNCTIGIGVLAMPYTIYVLGWLFSCISFVFIVLVNQFSIIILIKVKNLTKHSNYSTISSYIFKGKILCIIVSSLICIGNFGYCKYLFIKVSLCLVSCEEPVGKCYKISSKIKKYLISFTLLNGS